MSLRLGVYSAFEKVRTLVTQKDTYFIAFSSILGINLANNGLDSSRQGFVLTSISHGLKSSSIMKS